MKGVPIKFRGKEDIKDGSYIYGDFVTRDGGAAIRVRQNTTLFNLHEYEVAVIPDTVSQLVGYDANGAEVYEGDRVKDTYALGHGDVGTVSLSGLLVHDGNWDSCKYILDPQFIEYIKMVLLKENDND